MGYVSDLLERARKDLEPASMSLSQLSEALAWQRERVREIKATIDLLESLERATEKFPANLRNPEIPIVSRILSMFRRNPGERYYRHIANTIGANHSSVASVLRRNPDHFVQVGRGIWKLKETVRPGENRP